MYSLFVSSVLEGITAYRKRGHPPGTFEHNTLNVVYCFLIEFQGLLKEENYSRKHGSSHILARDHVVLNEAK